MGLINATQSTGFLQLHFCVPNCHVEFRFLRCSAEPEGTAKWFEKLRTKQTNSGGESNSMTTSNFFNNHKLLNKKDEVLYQKVVYNKTHINLYHISWPRCHLRSFLLREGQKQDNLTPLVQAKCFPTQVILPRVGVWITFNSEPQLVVFTSNTVL
jgi:hypothetical protein